MVKYKEYVQRMLNEEKEIFERFKKLHDEYALNPEALQEKFNTEGEKVLAIVRDYENRLCRNSEQGGYSHFTPKLAEKFQAEVKRYFPFIDHIGLKTIKHIPSDLNPFNIKRIRLS